MEICRMAAQAVILTIFGILLVYVVTYAILVYVAFFIEPPVSHVFNWTFIALSPVAVAVGLWFIKRHKANPWSWIMASMGAAGLLFLPIWVVLLWLVF
jgi:hypothetical protein